MTLALENFTPVSAAIGGMLIGLAAVMLLAFNGRIAGISGIFSGMVFGQSGDRLWRWMFVFGLLLGPVVYSLVAGAQPAFNITSNWVLIVLGGMFVGFGTRLGSGCTSGHGVCGLARFSVRSLVAVPTFMVAGFATVFLVKHFIGA